MSGAIGDTASAAVAALSSSCECDGQSKSRSPRLPPNCLASRLNTDRELLASKARALQVTKM